MNIDETDPLFYLKFAVALFISIALIPVIVEISAVKRALAVDILSIGFSVDGGWELRLIFILMAIMIMLLIPSWGILKIVFEDTTR
ncbi:hypothetical protein OB919_19995 [Halobacteria archaeon AArc-curdl1]|uniref:Uncharacterized protein n=1 Tax=Natronosalvus hydrolyticus TaxID=2979988 RepID=A0AAP2ZBW6_9EURY|nr:hypothetical protein [Halobacteria archaeon AArc-curdl1]